VYFSGKASVLLGMVVVHAFTLSGRVGFFFSGSTPASMSFWDRSSHSNQPLSKRI
jgi:hypothetical protein